MFKYVLIIWINMGATSSSITTHEFLSMEACEKAGNAAASQNAYIGPSIHYVCAPNDTDSRKWATKHDDARAGASIV